ncbi:MAG: PAS domain S-box protein [Bacteroidota bacterium]|nr:PAS domain S-box protein [Bacteroidota bacterium]
MKFRLHIKFNLVIVIVIVTIVSLVISFLVISAQLSAQQEDGYTIISAERQKVRDMKITQTVDAITKFDSKAPYRKVLEDSLESYLSNLIKTHQYLQGKSQYTGFIKQKESSKIKELFAQIEPHYDNIVENVQKITQDTAYRKFKILNELIISQSQYLPLMTQISDRFSKENQKREIRLKYTTSFILIILLLEMIFVVISVIKNYNQQKIVEKQKNEIQSTNEDMVAAEEELKQNNEELRSLNDHLEFQKDEVEKAHIILQDKNLELELYHMVIEQSPVAILFTNLEGNIQYVNSAFSEITGYSSEEVINKNPKILNSGKTPHKTFTGMWNTVKAGEIWNGEFINHTKTGKEFIEKAVISPIKDADNKITGYVGIKNNITKLKITEKRLQKSREELEFKHKQLTGSINYANLIQQGLLTSKGLISKYLSEYFLIFKPKDVVSGDFYYINKLGDHLIFTVADCTGHGVAGAFLSVLGITYIHEIVNYETTNDPGTALNILRNRFKRTAKNFGQVRNVGLDIALCTLNTKTNVLQYAGAYNPMYIIRKGKLIEYKATRNPIGNYPKETPFKNHNIQLEVNDQIYLFSDGYPDQFGDPILRKINKKRFKDILLDNSSLPMARQKENLESFLNQWQGKEEQVDDITVLGLKVSFE